MTTDERTEKKVNVTYDLLSRQVRPICNWHEFLMRWEAAVTFEEMMGLLHAGFSISCFDQFEHKEPNYDHFDRLIFYLEIADGWNDTESLRVRTDDYQGYRFGKDKNGNPIWKSSSELRQILAQKAFDLLCLKFFGPQEKGLYGQEGRFERYWVTNVVTERFFPVILDFFRAQPNRYRAQGMDIRNLSRRWENQSHNEKQAISFLLDLAVFLWKWEEKFLSPDSIENDRSREISAYNVAMRDRLDSAKPWMIEVLSFLGRLDVLKPFILKLDEACLAKLKEIALRSELHCGCLGYCDCPGTRQVSTVEEACLSDSSAAWLLVRHGVVEKEVRRLRSLSEAEEALAEAEARLKGLQG